jgi:transposase
MHKIGEDRTDRLDIVPAQLRVIVTVRPKYACRACTDGVTQAPAPAALIEGGLPTEGAIAHVLVSKYADHLPLYRQSQMLARSGDTIDRGTLADWVGVAGFHLRSVVDRLAEHLKASTKLFMDETTAPVLDPGRGRTKTGYLWALARDDRGSGGDDPPGVVFFYAPGRAGENAENILRGFDGILQLDGYQGYNRRTRHSRKGMTPSVWRIAGRIYGYPRVCKVYFVTFQHNPRLRSSIRPVLIMRPASSASMVNSASWIPITHHELEARCAQRVCSNPGPPGHAISFRNPSHSWSVGFC